ncbi:MAG: ribosome maturation factor RimM [Porticoccaceae bacterium]|nr:ribosome maturation factor RimM [Porticoccaceae bacterium]
MVAPQSPREPRGLAAPDDLVVVGRITTVHGVQGWVKIHSFTEPESNIFDYLPWWMTLPGGLARVEVDQFRATAKGFIAHIVGLDDRDQARLYCQRDIQVSAAAFPEAAPGEYYWHQLEGMKVVSTHGGRALLLGTVDGFFDTGASDVMVVKGDAASHDRLERLIPFVDDYIVEVDMAAGTVLVDWDPDFDKE